MSRRGTEHLLAHPANVIVVGMAEKMGKPISFKKFMLYGMPLMIESVIICHAYIWLRYYVLKI